MNKNAQKDPFNIFSAVFVYTMKVKTDFHCIDKKIYIKKSTQ